MGKKKEGPKFRTSGPKRYADKIIEDLERTQGELKEWQVLAGRFASLANSLANIIIQSYRSRITSNELDFANDVIDTVEEYLVFDERE